MTPSLPEGSYRWWWWWTAAAISPAAGRLPCYNAALLQDTEPREKVLKARRGRVCVSFVCFVVWGVSLEPIVDWTNCFVSRVGAGGIRGGGEIVVNVVCVITRLIYLIVEQWLGVYKHKTELCLVVFVCYVYIVDL